VYTMADLVENRDKNTGGHIERTSMYMKILIDSMIEQGIYKEELKVWDLDSVISSARLHDIGKIAISDTILNKPGKLTDEEFNVMKTHCMEGENIIDRAMLRAGDTEFLHNAKMFAVYHHERWDGSGYPYKLKEIDIPLHGRIMAVIDVYDALMSVRPYKKALLHDEALQIIVGDSGKHFDPFVVDVFNKVNKKIETAKIE